MQSFSWMLDSRCWILDAGCWILDAYWILDAGCLMLDTRYWMLDDRRREAFGARRWINGGRYRVEG
jgi:hypothetical protein